MRAGVYSNHGQMKEVKKNSPKMKSTLLREHKALECQKVKKKDGYGKYNNTDDTRTE